MKYNVSVIFDTRIVIALSWLREEETRKNNNVKALSSSAAPLKDDVAFKRVHKGRIDPRPRQFNIS